MLELISVGVLCSILGATLSYIVIRNENKKNMELFVLEGKAKATAIEFEANKMLQNARVRIQGDELRLEKKFQKKLNQLDKRSQDLKNREESFESKERYIDNQKRRLAQKEEKLDKLIIQEAEEVNNIISKMENIASLTKSEARDYILKKVEEQSKSQMASIIRKYEAVAKEDGERKANYILAQATTRYAGEFAGERLINIVTLPSDEHKGRIIGKEGRNIRSLETILGVDIIVDETPGVIIISGFNLYRRAIATRVVETLVHDGRIHPGRIEEVFENITKEFESKIYEEGENILIDLGLFPMHKELIKLLGKLKYRASYGQNALGHTLEVAKLAGTMAVEMGGDEKLAMRAGILHDIGKALTQEQGGSHVEIGARLCKKYNEHPSVINAIFAHHGHLEPDSVESAAVCAADVISAARPGARREVLENFTKRVKEIEEIATSKKGVISAYAINAGREIRVFLNAHKVSDNEAVMLSRQIAQEIEEKVSYPGEIKVNVIRELRSTSFAK
ncbi:FIG002344: Hydrolase (HAD superfamily) [hydrothermal vent metagenome]|uniref:FIG002344: Hydrolase (HAD superfamily) n=1 Tax=hydrothermal vent metagenome TaxID=652676 RepID=A0A1W1EI16_9ZZZZ